MGQLREHAISMLSAFKKHDQRKLRKLNDDILHMAALEFDQVSYNMAIYSYVLSKIVSKPRFLRNEYEPQLRVIERTVSNLIDSIERNPAETLTLFTRLEDAIGDLERGDPRFVNDLCTKGRLKVAATMYAQGIGLGVASEMTGIDKQEILDYAGASMMFDRMKEEKTLTERMRNARALIGE